MRVLNGRAATVTHEFLDEETPIVLDAVAVTVTDSLGVVALTAPATSTGDLWSVTVPQASLSLGVYTVVWDGVTAIDTTTFEVVESHMFTVPEARASDEYLADVSVFSADDITSYREVVEREFEQITGRSFTTRTRTQEYRVMEDRTSEVIALIPDACQVLSLTINGVVADASTVAVTPLGTIYQTDNLSNSRALQWRLGDVLTAVVRYGFSQVPADVKRVGMIRLRHLMAAESSAIPDRATSWQPQEGGSFRLATPGMSGFRTGIPEVDSTLSNYTLDPILAVWGLV